MNRLIEQIKNTLRLYSDRTNYSYLVVLKQYLEYTGNKLDPKYLQDFINHISKDHEPSTVWHRYYAMKTIFKILGQPVPKNIVLPRIPKAEITILDKDRLRLYYKLVKQIKNQQVKVVLLLLPKTGLRIDELLNLTVSDIKQENGVHYLEVRGKGSKVRKVPLSKEAYEILSKYCNSLEGREKLFTITSELVRYFIRRMRGLLGLPRLTPHTLRHTFATHLIREGVDPKTVSEILGHSSLRFTLEKYCHPTLEQKHKAIKIIDQITAGGKK